jgi:hypothetical protein
MFSCRNSISPHLLFHLASIAGTRRLQSAHNLGVRVTFHYQIVNGRGMELGLFEGFILKHEANTVIE